MGSVARGGAPWRGWGCGGQGQGARGAAVVVVAARAWSMALPFTAVRLGGAADVTAEPRIRGWLRRENGNELWGGGLGRGRGKECQGGEGERWRAGRGGEERGGGGGGGWREGGSQVLAFTCICALPGGTEGGQAAQAVGTA